MVEGATVVREALASGIEVHDVFMAEGVEDPELAHYLAERDITLSVVGDDVIGALSDTVTPQGVVAVVSDPSTDPEILTTIDLCLVLAAVRDPGNAGTLVRSAAAAGAGAIVFATGSVDPLHPKVVRSAAGALFHVPIVRGSSAEEVARALREGGVSLVGTAVDSEKTVYDVDLTAPVALVLGNEAWGLPAAVASLLDDRVAIPMPGPVESLNVSTAGAIVLFEALRQRGGLGAEKRGEAQGGRLSSGSNE